MDDSRKSNTLCALPWTHLFISEDGRLSPCCVRPEGGEQIQDEDHLPVYAYEKNAFQRAWNSSLLKSIRSTMLKNKQHPYCESCYKNEALGLTSVRTMPNLYYEKELPSFPEKTNPDGSTVSKIRYLDIRVGNICNIACRMCMPDFSTALVPEFKKLYGEEYFKLHSSAPFNLFREENFQNQLKEIAPDLERIHFAGGEPLINEESFDFLEYLVSIGRSKEITLIYTTNLTVLPQRAYELWPKFKDVILWVSIDGLEEVYDYIRFPATWEIVNKNLDKIEKDWELLNLKRCGLGLTVQVYNIFNLVEFCKYASNFKRIDIHPGLHLVHGYLHQQLDIRVLPHHLKMQIKSEIEQYIEDLLQKNPEDFLVPKLKGVINHMISVDLSHLKEQLQKVTLFFDRSRKQNLVDYVPELAKWLFPDP